LRSLNRDGHPEWFCISKMHEHINKLLEHHLQRLYSATEIVGSKMLSYPSLVSLMSGLLVCIRNLLSTSVV
jgi:hypothetical protein